MKILLLEDEYSLRMSIKEYLIECGFFVEDFANGDEAADALYFHPYDILLLDIKVPKKNGMDLLREIRESGIETPAIFISSITEMGQIERGYEVGCCDYIRKPFALKELYLRIMQAYKSNVLRTMDDFLDLPLGFRFDIKNLVLTKKDQELSLTKKEMMIIAILVEHIGKAVCVEEIEHYVWGEEMDPANVRVHINNLRKKLKCDLVVNVRGFGYKIDQQ